MSRRRGAWKAGMWCWAIAAMSASAVGGTVVFVDADASGPVHDGSSWADAFTDLQEGLDAAEAAAGTVNEIWVAAGTIVLIQGRDGTMRVRSRCLRAGCP